MVNWFNQTDIEYRTQLRDLNDRNYARFEAKLEHLEAKLEQRFSKQDANWQARLGTLETAITGRFIEQDAKWQPRLGTLETAIARQFGEQDAKWEARFAQQDVRWERRQNEQFSRLLKWMFVFWSTTLVSTIGLSIVIVRLLQ